MRKYKLVGLTGQTGAGKGVVSSVFREKGWAVIDADKLAREALAPESPTLYGLCAAFGKDIIKEDGSLDRPLLAERAFSSRENTDRLNSLTHPYILQLVLKNIEQLVAQGEENILYDAPQLIESRSHLLCDHVITVLAKEETRLERIMNRDNISYEASVLRIKAQHKEDFYIAYSDTVIENNGSREDIINTAQALEKAMRYNQKSSINID